MAWNLPVSRAVLLRGAEATSGETTVHGTTLTSFTTSLALRLFHLSMQTGRFSIRLSDRIAELCRDFWDHTLSVGFEKVADGLRKLSMLNRSRAVRGEFSICGFIFRVCRKTAAVCLPIGETFVTGGAAAGFGCTGRTIRQSLTRVWARNRRVFNYLAPAAGLAVLAFTVYFWTNMTFAVSVSYNGNDLGVVRSEQVYRSAVDNVEAKVSDVSGSGYTLNNAPVFQFRLARNSELLSADSLSDKLVGASGGEVSNGYGLYVDNRLVGANADSQQILAVLDTIIAPYKSNSANRSVSFAQDIQIKSGIFPTAVMRTSDDLKNILTGSGSAQSYMVKKGDSMPMIANMFHVSVDSLYAMNTSVTSDGLSQGDVVKVDGTKPTVSVRLTRNEVSTQQIPYAVEQTPSSRYASGVVKLQSAGRPGVMQVVSEVTYVGSTIVSSQVVSTVMLKAPVPEEQLVGTRGSSSSSKSSSGYDGSFGSSYSSGSGGSVVAAAERYLGSRYVSGGSSPSGFDCSGFTSYIYSKFGVSLDHSAAGQYSSGSKVGSSSLQAGDLVFFRTGGSGSGISHVGIYIGGGEFINAENHRAGVAISSLSGYWANTYAGAVRVK